MSDKTPTGLLLYCSFCGKSQREVRKLIAGPRVFICDECIELCNDIIREEVGDAKTPGQAKEGLTPQDILSALSSYVVEQDDAKKILALAVHDHYARLNAFDRGAAGGDVELEKSNILLVGPTGSGKTLLAQTLARLLNVPFVIADATKMTEAGYVGEDVESMLQKLLAAADFDTKKAERGIIYLDEIDKIARPTDSRALTRDVSGEGVQQALLKIFEGTIALVPPQGGKKLPGAEYVQVDTRNILFIVGGAFDGLVKEIAGRKSEGRGIGFTSQLVSGGPASYELLREIEPQDLIKFGLIPELVGRLPIIAPLSELSEEALVRILFEPKNALVKQFAKLMELQGVELLVTEDAARAVAELAKKKGTGGRGLRNIMERALRDFRFELPDLQKGAKKVKKVVVTRDTILLNSRPEIELAE